MSAHRIPVDLDLLELDDEERIVAAVLIVRTIDADGGMSDHVLSADGEGDELDVVTAVGMTAVGQHTFLTQGVDDDD